MEFRQTTLDNGLTVIAEVNPAAASMAAGFFVRTGSRDETLEVSGVSHFLEHMMFKGTAARSAGEVNRQFDDMGANYNAFTSEENTVFYGAVLPEFQERLLGMWCDLLRPALRGEDFDIEKNVILEEIAVYDDQPRFLAYEKLMQEYFQGHPLGNSIPGTKESIAALTRDQMQGYFDRRYSSDNIVVVGVGKLDFDRMVDQVARLCSHWPATKATRHTPPAPRPRKSVLYVDPKITREHIAIASSAPASQESTIYVAQLLATILGDCTGSRLFYALIEPAIVDDVSMAYDPMDQAGAFLTFLSADTTKAAQALEIARREFGKFADQGPTEEELQAAKNKIASAATLKGEIPMGRLTSVGFDWVYRREYVPLAQQIDRMFAVTRQDVHELAKQCDLTATTVLAMGPMERL